MSELDSFFQNWIKPYVCTVASSALMFYFLTPLLLPMLSFVPLNPRAQTAILVGGYGAASYTLCAKLGL
jgi:hypothetical protein